MLKFHFDACFQGGKASANFHGKVEKKRNKERMKEQSSVDNNANTVTPCVPCEFMFIGVLGSKQFHFILVAYIHVTLELLHLSIVNAVQTRHDAVAVTGGKSLQHVTQRRLMT